MPNNKTLTKLAQGLSRWLRLWPFGELRAMPAYSEAARVFGGISYLITTGYVTDMAEVRRRELLPATVAVCQATSHRERGQ